ncbi:hypothetical protein Pat9b_2030 [Pantoea sp. At-9b]|nr:hypothetical protein Pat9b_2030 [Pantoea sp. At-9b]
MSEVNSRNPVGSLSAYPRITVLFLLAALNLRLRTQRLR